MIFLTDLKLHLRIIISSSSKFFVFSLRSFQIFQMIDSSFLFRAMCCSINSIFCDFPEVVGGYEKTTCLCFEGDNLCSRPQCFDMTKQRKNSLCILQKGQCYCINAKTCCKGVSQLLCLENRRAFPCDDNVPCALSLVPFCTCCVKWSCYLTCCSTLGAIKNYRP